MNFGAGHRCSLDLSGVAMAEAGNCSSNSALSLGTSICPGAALKRQKKKKKGSSYPGPTNPGALTVLYEIEEKHTDHA